MRTHRLEAFSDGVRAIIITIMVPELPTPDGAIGRLPGAGRRYQEAVAVYAVA